MKLVIIAIGLFLLAMYFTRVEEKDIQSCMKTMEQTREWCEVKLNV